MFENQSQMMAAGLKVKFCPTLYLEMEVKKIDQVIEENTIRAFREGTRGTP